MAIVYILTNPAMDGYVKIGKTDNDLEQRMKQLDTTGLPLPFQCYYAAKVEDAAFVEKKLHEGLVDRRVRPNREFFEIDPKQVASLLKIAELEDVTPKGDVLTEPTDKEALEKSSQRRSAFNFEMVGIKPNSVLIFSKNETATATVVDNKRIEFEGEITSLSASAKKIFERLGYSWSAVAGTDFWMYDGETLVARRHRLESEE